MPLGNWNVDWLNLNSQRRYPLADDATAIDDSGSFAIPDDFIVGLDLPVNAGQDVDPARFFVLHVGAFATGYSIIIGYQPVDTSPIPVGFTPADGSPVPVASALIPRQGFTRNSVFPLGGSTSFPDAMGKIVIGRLDNVDQQPPGFWTFSLNTARLDTDAIRPIVRGVSSIVCVNGDQRTVALQGVVELRAGTNMQIVPIISEGADPVIVFNAINGEGTIDECVCEGDAAQTPPIERINGVTPSAEGDFTVVGSDCIQVEIIQNGIRLIDTCSAPCCGCVELERITSDLERLGQQAAAVETFASTLQSSVDAMNMAILGSKLNDKPCVVCE